jgi:hypothetical protein
MRGELFCGTSRRDLRAAFIDAHERKRRAGGTPSLTE